MCHRMKRLIALLISFCFLTGCAANTEPDDNEQASDSATEFKTISVTETPTEAPTVPETTAPDTFLAYQLTVQSPKLAIHSGPGYSYDIVDYITDQGKYLIIAHEFEPLGNGEQTTWGKLETANSWINLDDALARGFEPYLFTITYPYMAIYSGPGYNYSLVNITPDPGVYTIVEESVQYFYSGRSVTWGKLKSGVGWICLDDVDLNIPAPCRCTECGRADVAVSRYGLCDPCHERTGIAMYGDCEKCGISLGGVEAGIYDGKRCFSCHVCDNCGVALSEDSFVAVGMYLCIPCYELVYCRMCGADCSLLGTMEGLCNACYDAAYNERQYCRACGTDCTYRGFAEDGLCEDCYLAQLPPQVCSKCGITFQPDTIPTNGECADCRYSDYNNYICCFCGNACEPWDSDNVCSDCEGDPCMYCNGPLSANHNCDDYPNIFCPNCDWSMHTTGVGTDGFVCPYCGTHFFP